MEYVLFVLLGLAIPVAWTAAFFLSLSARARLQVLERRFETLEQELLRVMKAGGAAAAAAPSADVARGADPAPDASPSDPLATPRPGADTATFGTMAARWQAAEPPRTAPVTDTPAPEPTPAPAADVPALDAIAAREQATDEPAMTTPVTEPALAAEPAAPPAGDAAPPAAPPGQTVPPTSTPATPSGPGFEQQLGTRWVVWVGGLALALGAIFLVRYSIEQGLVGPGTRIVLGALFALALVASGEWMRRKEVADGIANASPASIPAILTAAGTTAAYATTWAAYGLYGFLSPGSAFILLGIVALATLAAALLHGPALAGLGLIGAYVAPLLVSSQEPSFWALYIYLTVVTAAAFALARIRLWRWLAITAVAASALWILPGLSHAANVSAAPHAFYLIALMGLAAALIVAGLLFGPESPDDNVDAVSSGAVAAYLAAGALLVVASGQATLPLIAFTILLIGAVGVAWFASAATLAVPAAAVLATLVILEWAFPRIEITMLRGSTLGNAAPGNNLHLVLGLGWAALFGASGYLAQFRVSKPLLARLWAGSAALAPIAIMVALYFRIGMFERSLGFAALAMAMAALYAAATESLNRRESTKETMSDAFFAVGAVASLALALAFALDRGWLTVGLALMAPGIAFIADKRPLPALRWLAAACAVLVSLRVLWDPRIVGDDVGTTPIFNWLLWGYGVPAISFWVGATILRRRADDTPARMLDSAAILFTVLTVTLQIRHYMTGGNIYAPLSRLAELGPQVTSLIAMTIGLEHVRRRSGSPIHNIGALLIGGAALVIGTFGILFAQNPALTGELIDGRFFNLILLSFGIPALLAIALTASVGETRSPQYQSIVTVAAAAFVIAYVLLQVRRFYQGPNLLLIRPTSLAEVGTDASILIALAIGYERIRQRAASAVQAIAARASGEVAIAFAAPLLLVWRNPALTGDPLTGLFVNDLLIGFALPGLLFAALLKSLRDPPLAYRSSVTAAAGIFILAYLMLQVRRFFQGADIGIDRPTSIAELGIHVSLLFAAAIGLEVWRRRSADMLHNAGALVTAGVAIATAAGGLLIARNPVFTGEPITGAFFNSLMPGYALPAMLAIVLALAARQTRPMPMRMVALATSVILSLAYLSLQVRRFYQGPDIGFWRLPTDPELWTYSVVWLVFGVVLLLIGIWLRSLPARAASACIILLTVAKVFLYDLAGIGGIWRALSFIGLGLVLVGIGLLYQRLLFPPKPADAAPPSPPPSPVTETTTETKPT